jgi:hypothetical protein
MMDRYLAQCADEAFKALLTDDDLNTRLDAAAAALTTAGKALIETAPSEIREALAEVERTRGDTFPDRANAIRRAIESIREEHACQTRQPDA